MIGTLDRKPAPDEPAGNAATDLGAMLRDVRSARGVSLRDASASLRIRLAYLEAIETGRFKDLPGPTYASGFLRAYAAYLGVDGDDVMIRFKAALEGFKRPTNLVLPSPAEAGHMPTGSVFLVAAIIAIGAYGGWYYLSVEGRDPGEFFAAVPQRIAGLLSREPGQEPAQPAPGEPKATVPIVKAPDPPASEPTSAAAPRPAGSPADLPVTPPPDAAPREPEQTALLQPLAPPAPPPPPASAPAEATAPPAASVPEPAATSPAARIVLRATADSWVELRAPGESPILSRILKRGETFDVPPRDDLVLTTGNAGGLEIAIDGKALPPLGPSGTVQRNVALNPDTLAAVNR